MRWLLVISLSAAGLSIGGCQRAAAPPSPSPTRAAASPTAAPSPTPTGTPTPSPTPSPTPDPLAALRVTRGDLPRELVAFRASPDGEDAATRVLAALIGQAPDQAPLPPMRFGYRDPVTLNVLFGAATRVDEAQRAHARTLMQAPETLATAWLQALEWFDPKAVTWTTLPLEVGDAAAAIRFSVQMNQGQGPEWALEIGAFVRGDVVVVLGEGYVRTWSRVPPVDWVELARAMDAQLQREAGP